MFRIESQLKSKRQKRNINMILLAKKSHLKSVWMRFRLRFFILTQKAMVSFYVNTCFTHIRMRKISDSALEFKNLTYVITSLCVCWLHTKHIKMPRWIPLCRIGFVTACLWVCLAICLIVIFHTYLLRSVCLFHTAYVFFVHSFVCSNFITNCCQRIQLRTRMQIPKKTFTETNFNWHFSFQMMVHFFVRLFRMHQFLFSTMHVNHIS